LVIIEVQDECHGNEVEDIHFDVLRHGNWRIPHRNRSSS
jgi:hypothetical protein